MYRPCTCNGHMAETDPKRANFYHSHFVPRGWELEYTGTLASLRWPPTLYLTGRCDVCHGDLRERINLSGDQAALLPEIYRIMQYEHPYDKKSTGEPSFYYGACKARSPWYSQRDKLTTIERNRQFLNLFHEFDRPQARLWLEQNHPTQEHEHVLRDTGGELFCKVIQLARENGDMVRAEPLLDYILPSEMEDNTQEERVELTAYEFDFIPIVNFGGSEGIYIDCYLRGKFDESKRHSLHVGTLKTLGTSLEHCKAMAELCGALMYHENRYVNENIHRYTPEAELKEEARRNKEREQGGNGHA